MDSTNPAQRRGPLWHRPPQDPHGLLRRGAPWPGAGDRWLHRTRPFPAANGTGDGWGKL